MYFGVGFFVCDFCLLKVSLTIKREMRWYMKNVNIYQVLVTWFPLLKKKTHFTIALTTSVKMEFNEFKVINLERDKSTWENMKKSSARAPASIEFYPLKKKEQLLKSIHIFLVCSLTTASWLWYSERDINEWPCKYHKTTHKKLHSKYLRFLTKTYFNTTETCYPSTKP